MMRNRVMTWMVFLGMLSCIFISCDEKQFTPKPKGYFAVSFPEKKYRVFEKEGFPYRFEYPQGADIVRDTFFFNEKTENPWWINMNYKDLGGIVYISYKEIGGKQTLAKLLEDSYFMSHYHSRRADYINEPEFHTANHVHGIFYEVGGDAASAFQFYATDSVKHFIRGALYFNTVPNADSLRPINEYIIGDLQHLVKTLQWTR